MWQTIIEDEIWLKKEFLPESLCSNLCRRAERAKSFRMAPGEGIRKVFSSMNINATIYDYTIHYVGIREDLEVQTVYQNQLNEFFNKMGFKKSVNFHPDQSLQFFLKSFSEQSFYEVHAEPVSRYGEFAFVHFLQDCEGGELVFPGSQALEQRWKTHPGEKKIFEDMERSFLSNKEPIRVIGPTEIQPRRNICVIFRTGSVHWVNPPALKLPLQRLVVTGWPFVTPELISDLNQGCGLKQAFQNR